MPQNLEHPPGQDPNWDSLYIAREDDVTNYRPIYCGDVFRDVTIRPTRGDSKKRWITVIQHPCAMRPDGVNLADSLLVARVRDFNALAREQWTTNGRLMPFPDLRPSVASNQRNQAAWFDQTYHVHPDDLADGTRVACLSEIGTYLLLQRWVYHSSRVVVPTFNIAEMNSHVYAEADLLEAWYETALGAGVPLDEAKEHAEVWLREEVDGGNRRILLRQIGMRSHVNRAARERIRELYSAAAAAAAPAEPNPAAAHTVESDAKGKRPAAGL